MGPLLRAGSSLTAVVVALVVVSGCAATVDDRVAVDRTSSASGTTKTMRAAADRPLHPRSDPHGRRLICVHSRTVPAASPDLETRYWQPMFVQCRPARPLLGQPRNLEQQPGR
jgi:hypothetical protein